MLGGPTFYCQYVVRGRRSVKILREEEKENENEKGDECERYKCAKEKRERAKPDRSAFNTSFSVGKHKICFKVHVDK
jgi:hypothetical protein